MPIIVEIRVPGEEFRVEIQNDRSGDETTGNYNVQYVRTRPRGQTIRRFGIEGHERALGYEALLAKVFERIAATKQELGDAETAKVQ